MKKLAPLSISLFLILSCSNKNKSQNESLKKDRSVTNKKVLAISDIHFNPFDICEKDSHKKDSSLSQNNSSNKCTLLMKNLTEKKAKEWKNVFEKHYGNTPFSNQGENTNYPLYKNLLEELKRLGENEKFKFAVVLGDHLTHNFHTKYKYYAPNQLEHEKNNFIKKTFEYLSISMSEALPKDTKIYPVIGNNDSYIENYNVDNLKTSTFYQELRDIWSENASDLQNSTSFLEGGFYSIKTNVDKLFVTALNTNIFSHNAKTKENIDIGALSTEQLKWFEQSFKELNGGKAFIISHIPCGIDAYASSVKKKPSLFWKNESMQNSYIKILNENSKNISGIFVAHTHHDVFQILDSKSEIYTVSVPSVSQAHQNNSGIKIFHLDDENKLIDSLTYYFDNLQKKWIPLKSFNEIYQSKNMFEGIQKLSTQWTQSNKEPDEVFLQNYRLNADYKNYLSAWKYYACAASGANSETEYKICLEKF